MTIMIRAEGIGKKYVLRHQSRQPYHSFRELLEESIRRWGSRVLHPQRVPDTSREEFWALNNISFEVKRGDRLGIIGRNGAGKSTILKILSRITEPTAGQVSIRGRVASLLEVGTGFHPELTGRENIYLNGAVLGMSKTEINRKFDDIVSFAEIEKFLDTPVKRYSSGMYVRLAFAVAAHLDPDILIIDEVLAVGDSQFQKKCLGKMEDVSKQEGRTVLFVSHNMGAIASLCTQAIFLRRGEIAEVGDARRIIHSYLTGDRKDSSSSYLNAYYAGDDFVILETIDLVDKNRRPVDMLSVDSTFGIRFRFRVLKEGCNPQPCFLVSNYDGLKLFQSVCTKNFTRKGDYQAIVWVPANLLNDSEYILTCALTTPNPTHIHVSIDMTITVHDNINALTRGDYKGTMHGLMRPLLDWEIA